MDSRTRIILEPRRLRFKLLQLKREALFTDIAITCHGKSLQVHKCILSTSSLYFKLLFTDSQLEPILTYDLTSMIKPENFQCLESIVNYMYSGEIHLSEENFALTVSLSKFFAMSDLTGFCSSYLNKILRTNNCLQLYLSMRQFDAQLMSSQYPVQVQRETEVQDKVLEMVDTFLYKDVLLEAQTLQVSTEDMLHLLNRGVVKNFCVAIVMEFVLRWLKHKQDTGAYQIASLLVHRAYEEVVSASEQHQQDGLTKVNGLVAHIEDILKAMEVSESAKTDAMKCELMELRQEVEKRESRLLEIKQELLEEMESEQLDVGGPDVGGPDVTDVGGTDVGGPEATEDWADAAENDSDNVDIENDNSNSDTDDYDAVKTDEDTEHVSEENGKTKKRSWTKIKINFNTDKIKQEMSDENNPHNEPENKPEVKKRRKTSRKGKVRTMVQLDHAEEEEDISGEVKTTADAVVLTSLEISKLEPGVEKSWTNVKSTVERNANGKYICSICDKEFKKKDHLTAHANSHRSIKPYRCVECGMVFLRSYHVIRHMRRKHSDKKSFECDVCNKEISHIKEMVAHSHAHYKELLDEELRDEKETCEFSEVRVNGQGQEEYWCTTCNKQFSRYSHLKEHVMIHTGVRPFTCDVCDFHFKSKYELNKHVNSVHLGKTSKFKCDNCKRPYNSKEAFEKHKTSCVGRGFQCEICEASFQRQYHLDRHQSTHSDDRPFPCPHCPKTFKYDNKLKAHLKTHGDAESDKRSVICELCGTVLKDVKYLKRHLVSHTGVKPHKCPVCLKTYTQAAGLQVHMRIHTGAKPFQCEICSMLFSVKSNLMRHQRRHRGDRRHKCDQCGKGFVMMSDLKRHYTMHTGEKNYACRFCNKRFSSNSKLPQHERIHTGEKPYECRVCGKRFIQSGDRTRHEAIHGLKAPAKTKSMSLSDMVNSASESRDISTSEMASSSDHMTTGQSIGSNDVNSGQGKKIDTGQSTRQNSGQGKFPIMEVHKFTGQPHPRSVIASNMISRETQNNQLLTTQTVNREPTSAQIVNQEPALNNQSKSSTILNMGVAEVVSEHVDSNQPATAVGTLVYLDQSSAITTMQGQDPAIATTQAQDEAMLRDMYNTGSAAYTAQSSASGQFLASLSDNTFLHY